MTPIRHQVNGEWRIELHCEAPGRMLIVPMDLQQAAALGAKMQRLAALLPGQPAETLAQMTAGDVMAPL